MLLPAVQTPPRRVAIALIAATILVFAVTAWRAALRVQAAPAVWCRIEAVPAIRVEPPPAPPQRTEH